MRRCNLSVNKQGVKGKKKHGELIILEKYFVWMLLDIWGLMLIVEKSNCYWFLNKSCFNMGIGVGTERG